MESWTREMLPCIPLAQLRVRGRPAVERAALAEVDLARDADLAERVAAAREACIDEGALSFAAAIYFP